MNNEMGNTLINKIVNEYGFNKIKIKNKISGLSALNYEIEIDDDQYILKKYRAKNLADINRIERITFFLNQNAIPTVLPCQCKSNLFHFELDDQYYAIYPKIPGKVLHEATLDFRSLNSAASLLVNFHSLGKQCQIDLYSTKNKLLSKDAINEKFEKINNKIISSPIDSKTDSLAKNIINLKLEIIKELDSNDYFDHYLHEHCDLIHGDFHNENMLFDNNNNILCLLDFEEVHFGNRIEDIINFIQLACCNTGFLNKNLNKARIFIKAYSSKYPLSKEDMTFGVDFYLYRASASFFLEDELYNHKNLNLIKYLERDLIKLIYLKGNRRKFVTDIINYI